MSNLPLALPRWILLGLTSALGTVGGCVGLNAIIKRNQAVASVKHAVAAQHITLSVDTWNILRSGVFLSVGCTVVSIVALVWQLILFRDMRRKNQTSSRQPTSTRLLPYEWMSLAFMAIWLLACNIPVTIFAATGSAKTTAYLGGTRLPDSLVQATQEQLGQNPLYWAQHYVRLQIIPPWFTFLFTAIAAVVSFIASKRRATVTSSKNSVVGSDTNPTESPIDKPTVNEKEIV